MYYIIIIIIKKRMHTVRGEYSNVVWVRYDFWTVRYAYKNRSVYNICCHSTFRIAATGEIYNNTYYYQVAELATRV